MSLFFGRARHGFGHEGAFETAKGKDGRIAGSFRTQRPPALAAVVGAQRGVFARGRAGTAAVAMQTTAGPMPLQAPKRAHTTDGKRAVEATVGEGSVRAKGPLEQRLALPP